MLTDHSPACSWGPNLSLPGVFSILHMDAMRSNYSKLPKSSIHRTNPVEFALSLAV